MRLVHLADLHLGFRQYQRLTSAGLNQREADVAGTFARAVDQIIALRPDLIVIGGDIFHMVRPSNPAILHAFRTMSRLVDALPASPVVMVAGNHDAPRTSEAGCILQLFRELGVYVADTRAERFEFPAHNTAVLAVPDVPGLERPALLPEGDARWQVLLLHGEIAGILPPHAAPAERAVVEIPASALHAERWGYVALGHYHVYRQIAANAWYSGSLDYTSSNPWGELAEERNNTVPGKGFIEHDLASGRHTFHSVTPSRPIFDLEPLSGAGRTPAELDALIADRLASLGDLDDAVVRLVVRDVHRHVVRDLDYRALRAYKRRALHFQLDTRKPHLVLQRSGTSARRATLTDLVADRLRQRVLPAGVDRDRLLDLGLSYLAQADEASAAALPVADA